MKREYFIIGLILIFLTGCASVGQLPYNTGTKVDLSQKNYRVVQTNAIGRSHGFKFLGLVDILPVTYTNAMRDLYEKADIEEGNATALANVAQEKSCLYLILFSIPRLTISADIVEFVK